MYVVDNLSNFLEEAVVIYEGKCSLEERMVLEKLSQKTAFNIQQYFIEHASIAKNILVRAGAGTGKTYSMVSRIAFLCNKYENPTENLIDDIAMITFTNDAADNMKNRLKQMFINYFVLTSNPKFLKYIENIDFMRISTIHKFAREIIKGASMQMGLGDNFAITSGDYIKEQIYEKCRNSFMLRIIVLIIFSKYIILNNLVRGTFLHIRWVISFFLSQICGMQMKVEFGLKT